MANSLKSANRVELRCLWAPWPRFGLDLSPLDNYDIIGAVALFGRHGVTWGDLAVTAKSPQVVCHLPDADYQVPDGGFHTLPLSYPVPHTVRRNFTLIVPPPPGAAPGSQVANDAPNNASFTASVVEAILKISPGDYEQFQAATEPVSM